MTRFIAEIKAVRLDFRSEYNRARFMDFLKKNEGMRVVIEPATPESAEQRRFFEGAVVKLITFYQEGLDYRNSEDCRKVRDWLKLEFNGEIVKVAGKTQKVAKSTKGALAKGFLDRVIDWMADNGYQIELLNPDEYKTWRDEIAQIGDNYIDYLLSLNRLKR
jgi:hypothetical protein